jgi:hypothetical protein
MPPEGDPSQYHTRFPVHVVAQGTDVIPGWKAVVTYLSPDQAYRGTIPKNLLIGYTSDEYYAYYSEIYHLLLDSLGFAP